MRLSLLIPVHNAGAPLEALLQSVAAARCDDLEIVAIDDGSSDNSADILHQAALRDPRLRVVTQPNVGVAQTRNRLLAAARGDYVWFVDADDLIEPTAMEALFDATLDSPDLVTFNGHTFGDGRRAASIYRHSKSAAPMSGETWLRQLLQQRELRHFVWLHWVRRAYLQQIGLQFAPDIAHEDVAWVTEVTLRARTLRYVETIGYHYRLHSASTTGSRDPHKISKRIHSYFHVIEQLRALNASIVMQATTRQLLQGEIVGQALQVFELAKELPTEGARVGVFAECRRRGFVASLWRDAVNFKRKRQVATMAWRQWRGLRG